MIPASLEEAFTVGSSQVVVRSGFNYVDLCSVGAGGAGRRGGGGAGGVATKTFRVLESEWGTFLTCSIGNFVTSAAGQATTINGTLNGAAITELKGFGGARGGLSAGGVGGAQSGGDAVQWPSLNADGTAGGDWDGDLLLGGQGGPSNETLLYAGGYYGAGSGGGGDATNGGNGEQGIVHMRWRV
jgi:hypothetical protein